VKEYLNYLGDMISGGELRVDLDKITTIMQWLAPTYLIEVRSFIGANQYLRKFIANFSTIVAPLQAMITKGKSVHWGKALQRLKEEDQQCSDLVL
jgi:hypothetical protein